MDYEMRSVMRPVFPQVSRWTSRPWLSSWMMLLWVALACICAAMPGRAAPNGDIAKHQGSEPSSALADYVAKPDSSFSWREISEGRVGDTSFVAFMMVSQTWRGTPWKHLFFVLRPDSMQADASQALLFVHGGRWKQEYENITDKFELPRQAKIFARLAETVHAPVGVLLQVPFQPMFERKEDALIAYTFDKYLQTGEQDWPLLLPMVKSATRAMDVMQEVMRKRWDLSIDSFTVTGASKRGWTTWLTAVADQRVAGIVPIVIDVLNMQVQMKHQRETWGELSDEIGDYTGLDIPSRLRTPQGQDLLSIVDPYSYRKQLDQPKLIMLGTNDRYWPLDALRIYWDDLPEPKSVLYVPNQGHGLRDLDRVIGSVSALHRYSAAGKPLPHLSWQFAPTDRDMTVTVSADRAAERVTLWRAQSASRDFRDSRWRSHRCQSVKGKNEFVCSRPREKQDYTAIYAELSFADKGEADFSLSTTVCIAEPVSGGAAPEC